MEQNKELYYPPSIEEFHVGFEFQISIYGTDNWAEMVLSNLTDEFLNKEGNKVSIPNCLRVKYLDKEDIESLGCIGFREMNSAWRNPLDKRPIMYYAEKNNAMMGFDFENHIVSISPKDPCKSVDGKREEYDYPPAIGLFRGIVKNKSEFKKILEQMNIQ